MRLFFTILLFSLLSMQGFSQANFSQKGFLFGVAAGVGPLYLRTTNGSLNSTATSLGPSIPNFKIGWSFTERFSMYLHTPGVVYQANGSDRGLEAIAIGGQYRALNRWWVMGATGLTFDAPAFYTVKKFDANAFQFGAPAIILGTGFDVWQGKRAAIDVEYRFFYAKSEQENGYRQGIHNALLLGLTWY